MIRPSPLLFLALPGFCLSSCIVADGPQGVFSPQPHATNQGWYERVPSNYEGETYQYGGRSYYGGRQERGHFTDHGRTYTERYQHGGQYYYGGQLTPHRPGPPGSNAWPPGNKNDSRPRNRYE